MDFGTSPTSPAAEDKKDEEDLRSALVENYKIAINALQEAMELEKTLGIADSVMYIVKDEITKAMQEQRPEIKRRYEEEPTEKPQEEDNQQEDDKGEKSRRRRRRRTRRRSRSRTQDS